MSAAQDLTVHDNDLHSLVTMAHLSPSLASAPLSFSVT